MKTIARIASLAEASQLAAYLRATGIEARVFEKGDPLGGVLGADVAVDDADADRAERARAEFDATRVMPGWATDMPAPDLSRLPAEAAPACPRCGARLPLAVIPACPACGSPVDVPELIAQERGPEALADCYREDRRPPVALPRPMDRRPCAGCGYNLEGLREEGTCPECGRAYSKSTMEERW
jgi:hypothetical protein